MSEKQIQTVRGECEWRRVREAKTTTTATKAATTTTTVKQQSYESFCRAPDAGVAAAATATATAAETATAAGYRHH